MEIYITTTFSIDCEVQKTFNPLKPINHCHCEIL